MTDMNKVVLIGRLTRDVDLRQIQSGTSIATFSLAVNYSYTTNGQRQEQCSFFNCILWGKSCEAFAKYVKKGNRVAVDGRLQQRTWQDKDGNNRSTVEIVVDSFQFLETRPHNGQNNNDSYNNGNLHPDNPPDVAAFDDSDIPF